MREVIAEMERTRVQGDDDMARRLERIAWRLVGVLMDVGRASLIARCENTKGP